METSSPPHPAIDLSMPLCYQLVYTLTDLLPPPLDDTPEGLVATRVAAPAARVDQKLADIPSENETNSQDAAFETRLSAQPLESGARGSGETDLREAMAESRLAGRQSPADGRGSPRRANWHDDGETVST
jgi:hypothetical protein